MVMTKEECRVIFEQVQANTKRLANCVGPHNFVDCEGETSPLRTFRKQRCTLCHGQLNELDVIWYKRGLEHGRSEK